MPIQSNAPHPFNMSKEEERLVDIEVQNLLAVEICSPDPNQFISNILTIPKKDGGRRPMVGMQELNQFAEHLPFKMEDISQLKDILQRGDYMTKLNLQDANLTIPVSPKSKICLRFFWKGVLYQFTCLPFGLSLSARLFTKTLKPVTAFLRSVGIHLLIFFSKICGDSSVNLLRRHPPNGRFSEASCRAHRNSDKGLGISMFCDKKREVNLEANPDYPISRFH